MNNRVLVITSTKIYDAVHSQEDEEYMEFELFMSLREYKMIPKRIERGHRQAVVEDNLYQTEYDAMNDIDERLGGTGKLGYTKLRERGIRIVGKKNKIG